MLTLPILLLLTLMLPLAVFVLLQWIGPRLGEPLAGYVGVGGAMATFGLAVVSLIAWLYGTSLWGFSTGPLVETLGWLPIGHYAKQRSAGFLDLVLYVDSLTIVMIAMVTFVSAIVHLYSLAYMRGDGRYPQFFAYLSLFVFAMVGLLLSASLVQLLIAWELVGLCSYLLIGFWHEKGEARSAAIKAFVTNRIGDVGFIIGMGVLVAYLGSATLPDLWIALGDPAQQIMSPTLLTVVGVLLSCGAIAKSAQFPLHAWLPDAMAGPTPVSALIHAATMVAAGVFLLARILPILTPDARLFLVIIGAITIAIGSLCAMAQRDIKKALALSTMAQLGFMVLAIGMGSWIGALFHLLTHAFFKSLLFLGAGTVVHAMHHETRLEKYGGLYRRLPVTAFTFAIGGLAMSGAPYLSGFYSKELILGHAAAWSAVATESGRGSLLQLALWIPMIGAYLTPLYMTRLWMLTFAGRTRDRSHSRRATEPGIMSFSLVILSGMAIVAGYAWFPVASMVEEAASETRTYAAAARIDPLAATWPTLASPSEVVFDAAEGVELRQTLRTPMEVRVAEGVERAHRLASLAWALGIALGILVYLRAFTVTDRIARWPLVGPIRLWLRERMFFDDLYDFVFAGAVTLLTSIANAADRVLDGVVGVVATAIRKAGFGTAWADDAVVDGAVRSIANTTLRGGALAAATQSGRVRAYVAAAVVLLTLGAGTLLLIIIGRG